MSKTSKKLLKLLQNVALLCYNDYTINARVTTVIFVNKYLEGMISMKFIIVGRNIEVTPGLRAAVEEKIGKLDKYFNPDTEVVSVRKEGKVQEAGLLLQNVEALATGESFPDGEIACFGDGSVDCPFTYLKVEVVYREE